MDIIYMGTPDFAVAPLRALLERGYVVRAVVTQPDRPKGRGMKLTPPPVKELALTAGIPVYQPETLKNGVLLPILEQYQPDLIAVVAYGRILPKAVLDFPKYGCINVHASLLPKYRGAAPIQWAVINGEKKTGVSTMYMDVGLDTGDVLLTKETPIGETETAEDLFERLAVLGAEALVETVEQIQAGEAVRIPQDDRAHTLAPPLTKEHARIDWTEDDAAILNRIRGCYSWPIAHTSCDGLRIKIFRAEAGGVCSQPAGAVVSVGAGGMDVAAGNHRAVRITEFQPEGSRRMTPDAYFRGHPSMAGKNLQ